MVDGLGDSRGAGFDAKAWRVHGTSITASMTT